MSEQRPAAGQRTSRRKRGSLYQEVTDKIIAELEQGRVPWVQPWGQGQGAAWACRGTPPPAGAIPGSTS